MPPTPPSKRRKLADTLTAQPAKRYQFTQQSGPRKGQKFNVVEGKSGLDVRKYASGRTAIAEADAGVNVAAQKRDVAANKGWQSIAKSQIAPKGGFDSSGPAQQLPLGSTPASTRQLAARLRRRRAAGGRA